MPVRKAQWSRDQRIYFAGYLNKGLPDMMSASEEGGHEKADILREVGKKFILQIRSKCGQGGRGSKIR